jgi:hypothetical protein
VNEPNFKNSGDLLTELHSVNECRSVNADHLLPDTSLYIVSIVHLLCQWFI